ncbi:hypothetical protein [Angustibacter sp. Root456]|uniref:hypothetical protein n=1 Tax=Angustibacter sp. Root456 TaxID=1736539 RepID=UPI000700D22A|nr:hypothetical protein [Angustibacter sp. Root456]KQX61850.1 hypothetical protein ASD06_14940 [Angustibacter sp. Root456]
MGQLSEPPLYAALRALAQDRHRAFAVAIAMAEIVEPLGELASLTPEPLSELAGRIRDATNPDQATAEAAVLSAIPALQEDEEPEENPAWFALGAVVAWIYAAESFGDPAGQRVVNTFARVDDVLEQVEEVLGVPGLCDQFYGAAADAARGDDAALRAMRGLGRSLLGQLRGVS